MVEARDVLDSIKSTAEIEEASLEHNGVTSGSKQEDVDIEQEKESGLSDRHSRSEAQGSETNTDGSSLMEDHEDLDGLSDEIKAELLHEIFPTVNVYTIKHSLKKCNGSWQRSLDELINITSFDVSEFSDEEKVSGKGIDAFFEERLAVTSRSRKHNNRSKKKTRSGDDLSGGINTSVASNPWQTPSNDINFISTRCNLSQTLVSSAYYANESSVQKTIISLLHDLIAATTSISSPNPQIQKLAFDLGQAYPSIEAGYLTALIQLTHPSTSHANDLARALSTPSAASSPSLPTSARLIPQYQPLNLDRDDTSPPISSNAYHPTLSSLTHQQSSTLAKTHSEAAKALTLQAQAAYRLSSSSKGGLKLGRGIVSSHYANLAREARSRAMAYNSAAADALVSTQVNASTMGMDLHGLNVSDAVRISRLNVGKWWENVQEEKRRFGNSAGTNGQDGFRIVVGQGRHSAGGVGRIGPAVVKALNDDGWDVESREGVVSVWGKRRRY